MAGLPDPNAEDNAVDDACLVILKPRYRNFSNKRDTLNTAPFGKYIFFVVPNKRQMKILIIF